ncbi:PREDICTED: protein F37C4.5-like [Priapulus caudatus]|uniref:Protein F37C4.5-like n=1 Tax=Priapulus caudatus TaxID=37621 RepID=A0ABM1E0K6_PRICU|nr:PREDICTED: protein F37C4.5-like [Priapulus caudatus]
MPTNPVFDVAKCPLNSVVVYQDRAEVCRVVKATLKTGSNEVVVKNFSAGVDKDSFRVEGKGAAVINEVTYKEERVTDQDSDTDEKIKTSRETIRQLEKTLQSQQQREQRLVSQKESLNALLTTVTKAESKKGQQWVGDEAWIGGIESFLRMYDEKMSQLDSQLEEVTEHVNDTKEKLEVERQNLNTKCHGDYSFSREVLVLLEATEDTEVELHVSYVVFGASWTPKYDVRVFTTDSKLKLTYYGVITQSTEEDWTDAKLSLSTAMPSVGGSVDPLETHELRLYSPPPAPPRKRFSVIPTFGSSVERSSLSVVKVIEKKIERERDRRQLQQELEVASAEVTEGVTSTTFEIARPSTIPCDNTGHKVTIGLIDLEPTFEYVCIPKHSPHAFYKARVKNTSVYALLAGPSNIFLDNNFIAKSQLKSVSPSEEFTCFLGVDPAIRITYPPEHKFHAKHGVFTKVSHVTHQQDVTVKNTREQAINITVEEQLPRSVEEKIKVTLLEPVLPRENRKAEDTKPPVRQNKNNNIEWERTVKPGEAETFTLKYAVEYPAASKLDSVFHTAEFGDD